MKNEELPIEKEAASLGRIYRWWPSKRECVNMTMMANDAI